MRGKKNYFLIGPMGAGKTSVGRALAKTLSYDYFDTDQAIEERAGANIPWIFDVEGEQGFRDRETKVIDELTRRKKIVLSTGGGSILREINRDMLISRGTVIYLDVSVPYQLARTQRTDHRPLLQGEIDKVALLTELRAKRHQLYEELADFTYNTDDKTVHQIVTSILHDIKK